VVQDIQKAIRNPISTADNIAELIEKDAVISLRLISISNSAMYRGTDKIQTVRQAVPRLGIKKTQSVVTAIANKNLYNVEDEKLKTVMEQFWLHSLATAFASKTLAEKLGFKDGESFFLMGLSHDIGKVLLFKPLTEMILKKETLEMDDVLKNIQEVHAEFGSALLQRWGFSQDIVRTARMHDSQKFSEATQKEILIVSLANIITRRTGYSLFNDENIELAETEPAKLLKKDAESLESICEEVKKNMQESKNIF
jgi:putative nucleotidyltransferase with HDIG domain